MGESSHDHYHHPSSFASGMRSGSDCRPLKAIVFSENKRILNWVGHYLVLRFGEDAVAQFWGQYKRTELEKFVLGVKKTWKCSKCGYVNDDLSRPRCWRRYLHLKWNNEVFQVSEEDVAGHRAGKRYYLGDRVEYRSGYWGVVHKVAVCGERQKGHTVLTQKVECPILLLSTDGSHGLDLSMVTNIFLLSKIWDAAVERQVISRAYRMGATGPVRVEQLIMSETVEQMLHNPTGDGEMTPCDREMTSWSTEEGTAGTSTTENNPTKKNGDREGGDLRAPRRKARVELCDVRAEEEESCCRSAAAAHTTNVTNHPHLPFVQNPDSPHSQHHYTGRLQNVLRSMRLIRGEESHSTTGSSAEAYSVTTGSSAGAYSDTTGSSASDKGVNTQLHGHGGDNTRLLPVVNESSTLAKSHTTALSLERKMACSPTSSHDAGHCHATGHESRPVKKIRWADLS
eukprot:CAMPEP_0185761720 /NCGR_PEP_ID=MMETSP1174-20130828/20660_1 /TAXON_ID=35687 /ORGANISM="Dictyocha speculum, Strain CCMP1381" /LENGTH=454 /DNA_ID=CAMNT_0028443075 /DNA_START=102 /DNA_END=1466 /DNA_ORIENTATION=+